MSTNSLYAHCKGEIPREKGAGLADRATQGRGEGLRGGGVAYLIGDLVSVWVERGDEPSSNGEHSLISTEIII